MKRESILDMAKKAVDIFNKELEMLKAMTGDYDSLVDEDNHYYHCEQARIVKSGRGYRVVFRYAYFYEFLHNNISEERSATIWEKDGVNYSHNRHTIDGEGYMDYINLFRKGIRKGKRFFALPTETIDKLQGY